MYVVEIAREKNERYQCENSQGVIQMAEQTEQIVEYIPVQDLVLWTENPRDPISAKNRNISVIKRAIDDVDKKWRLKKLAKEMGVRYDCSELPTVVYRNGIPIVYDGNRRVIIAMLMLGIYPEFKNCKFRMPQCPNSLPCNVTSKDIALDSVWRKHGDTGSWDPIARDIFRNKFWGRPKSVFLQLDEMLGGVIAKSSSLNQRFVGEEVLTNPRLKDIGIRIENESVLSRHDAASTKKLLNGVFELIADKKLSTRKDRKTPLSQILPAELKAIVTADKSEEYQKVGISSDDVSAKVLLDDGGSVRLPRRVKAPQIPVFGGKLGLEAGEPANLYRDIVALYEYYEKNKGILSDRFPALIRMALRLQCELIANCANSKDFGELVKNDYDAAKRMLSQQERTFLSTNNVTKDNIVSLLHTGAHNYQASYNLPQTIAMSLIVAGLLKLHCAKKGR